MKCYKCGSDLFIEGNYRYSKSDREKGCSDIKEYKLKCNACSVEVELGTMFYHKSRPTRSMVLIGVSQKQLTLRWIDNSGAYCENFYLYELLLND
jgi:hypothetical protein